MAIGYQMIVNSGTASGATVVGDVFEVRNITTDRGTYFDGNSIPADPRLQRYRWLGQPNASESVYETREVEA